MTTPVVLVVLDGFGLGDGGAADATAVAHTPFFVDARGDVRLELRDVEGTCSPALNRLAAGE